MMMKIEKEREILLNDPIYLKVTRIIREEILSGTFESGSRLKIGDLSKRYGISHMPIREALQQLQGEGIIIIEPNKGAIVRDINEKLISNIYDLRGAIETLLAVKAIPNLNSQDDEMLTTLKDDYEKAVKKKDIIHSLEINKQFHTYLYMKAENEEALKQVDRHWNFLKSVRLRFKFNSNRIPQIIDEHQKILEAITERNEKKIEFIVRKHSENAKLDILQQMKNL